MGKRGRPTINDDSLLREVAEILVAGKARFPRGAIVKVVGSDNDSKIRRLQRKWRLYRVKFLNEARKAKQNDENNLGVRINPLNPSALRAFEDAFNPPALRALAEALNPPALKALNDTFISLSNLQPNFDPFRESRQIVDQLQETLNIANQFRETQSFVDQFRETQKVSNQFQDTVLGISFPSSPGTA